MHSGYHAEVVCKSHAHREKSVWYGEWFIRAVSRDHSVERLLVPARSRSYDGEDSIRLREFKTANGLISFLEGLGFEEVSIPLKKGGRSVHQLRTGDSQTDQG
ncbi:hypothetical protein A9Q95_16310 [Rhodobacterales bacterium 59_46_T64]|nr:hypothetical protein A9Q95_16310 [Rhodobacterales bacterium 59_46_T64]